MNLSRTLRAGSAFCTCVLFVGMIALHAQEPPAPPSTIPIRPKAAPTGTEPEKPGYIAIRPKNANGTKPPIPATTAPASNDPRLVSNNMPKQLPAPTAGNEPAGDGKIIHESWDVLFVRGMKAGYFHTLVREYERDGKKFHYGIKTQKLMFTRFGERNETSGEDSTLETPTGEVITTRMRQGISREQSLLFVGAVKEGKLNVAMTIDGADRGTKSINFPDGVYGVSREARMMREKKPKPGESFTYQWYEGRVNAVVTFTVEAKAIEDIVIYEQRPPVKALRLEVRMTPVGDYEQELTTWVDATTYEPLKIEAYVPIFGGKAIILRTTKEFALAPTAKVPELNESQSIPLAAPVPEMHQLSEVTYRIALTEGKLTPERAFRTDDRQTVGKPAAEQPRSFDLIVKAKRKPAITGAIADPGAEFLSDSLYIDWNNDVVKSLAKQATAGLPATATVFEKAKTIESWVNKNMRAAEFSKALATCTETARTRTGDCTEFAMFAVGLCRAVGVPARTALGLVYAPTRDGKACFAFHMWFEVYADGQWIALDATLGQGSVGPGHLKIAETSWAGEESMAPLLPVNSLLGARPKIEIVRKQP